MVCALYTLVWCTTDAIAGGISTPAPLVVILFYATSFTWLYFNPSFITKKTLNSLVLQIYATGTLGVFLSDLSRTAGSFFNIPFLEVKAPLLVLGGAGPEDGVLLGGLYFIILILISWTVLRILKIRYQYEFGRKSTTPRKGEIRGFQLEHSLVRLAPDQEYAKEKKALDQHDYGICVSCLQG